MDADTSFEDESRRVVTLAMSPSSTASAIFHSDFEYFLFSSPDSSDVSTVSVYRFPWIKIFRFLFLLMFVFID